MKKIILVLVLLSCSVTYAGDPYVKTVYKGKNWAVQEVGITGEFKQCVLRSSPDYFDEVGKNPKYGSVHLRISYPSNNITFLGENIGVYFRLCKQATLQVDEGKRVAITPKTPMPGKSIIDSMMKGKVVKIEINCGIGGYDQSTFSLMGFTRAYKELQACAGIPSAQLPLASPLGVGPSR